MANRRRSRGRGALSASASERARAAASARAGFPVLGVILAAAAALRAVGIQYGLPFGTLLNPDEQSIVPRAWKMVHGGGLDPHWFDYPTLVLYLLAPFQAWQGAPSFLTARIVILVLGLGAIAATWWLGRRAYGPQAGVIGAVTVAVATIHVEYSRMAVTDVPLTLGVAIALGLIVVGRLEWAGLAVGLAASAKYPGVFLLVPLVLVGWGKWRRVATGIVLAAAAFLASSPFVLVHPDQAVHEALRVQRLAREGWLGFEDDYPTPLAFLDRLWQGVGPLVVLAGVGLALAVWKRSRADIALASFTIVYFLDLLTLQAHFDRYLLPLIPAVGVLAGRLAGKWRVAAPVVLALLIVPLWWSAADAVRLTRTDTRIVAGAWIAAHVPAGAAVAAESSTPQLVGHRVLPLLLPGPKRATDPNRDVARLRAEGIRYVVITGAVADRVLRARDSYPREARFYDELASGATQVYEALPGGENAGPWVRVYRL